MSIGLSKTQEEERKSTVNLSDEPKGNGVPKSVASRSTKLGELTIHHRCNASTLWSEALKPDSEDAGELRVILEGHALLVSRYLHR